MLYVNILQPILLITSCFAVGFFTGFFYFLYTFKSEQNDLEKNIIEFQRKQINFKTRTGGLENDRLNERPRRNTK